MLLHQIGLHLLVSNFVLVQINKVVHQVWKLLGSLDTTVCKEPTHMRLNHFSGHSSDWKLPSSIHAITTDGRSSIFGLWSGLNKQTMMVEFLRHLSALPSVSNVDSSGSADQTPSVRPSGCLTDWVQRVRPLHSHNEERSVRQRVRPLVDTPGEENAQIGTTVALVSNADVQSIPQPVPYFGMFVHCLTDHQGQSLTFTSERTSPGNRPKLVTKIGRSPWIVEVVEFLHPQSNKIRLWTLPATASFKCNCLKLDHPEKTEWRFLYQAWDELCKIYIEILLAFRMPTSLVLWNLLQTNGSLLKHFFRNIPAFVLSIHLPHENRSWHGILWPNSKIFINKFSRNFRQLFFKLWRYWYLHYCCKQKSGP